MKAPEDKEIFNLFGSRLTHTDKMDAFSDENWAAMEELLDGKARKKAPVIWIYRVASAIAALLLLFFGWYFFKPAESGVNRIVKSRASVTKTEHRESHETIALAVHHKMKEKVKQLPFPPARTNSQTNRQDILSAVSLANVQITNKDAIAGQLRPSDLLIAKKLHYEKPLHKIQLPRITVAVLAASDVNGVNSFSNNNRIGTNFTMQLSARITRRLIISTGASYAVKPYQTGFGDYKTNSPGWWGRIFAAESKPAGVTANCKVLDIPLNINYEFISKKTNSLMLGAGLSSYFMLNENYRFNFTNTTAKVTNIQVSNQNQHIFGVLNLNSTYQHQVNSNLGIVIQPYMKLPLTRIGFGQVDLRSAGIAAGFTWNINSFRGK